IVKFPHISNFTDFRLIHDAPYLSQPVHEHFDVIFLPGTKNTVEDMQWLRKNGMEAWIQQQYREGATIEGICGGYQILGDEILAAERVESTAGSVRGLGFIRAVTRLMAHKTMRLVAARTQSGIPFHGYEIHMGVTTIDDGGSPFAVLEDGRRDGVRLPRIVGTYIHGAFENQAVLEEVLQRRLGNRRPDEKDIQYERLADWFAEHVNPEVFAAEYLG